MRQRISHGTEIDAATPEEVAKIIAAAFDNRKDHGFHREPGVINLDATGAGQNTIKLTRQYGWLCERVTLTGGPNSLVAFYYNQVQGSDLAEVVQLGGAGMYSDSFANNLFVPAGSQLLVVCTGGAANGQTTYSLQVRLVKAAE